MRPHILARHSLPALLALFGSAAFAQPASAAGLSGPPLPAGVHLTQSGRYLEDMCKKQGPHCLGKWLLPVGWNPSMPLPVHRGAVVPEATNPCGTPSAGMTPTDAISAYKIPSTVKSNGKIVALIDLEDGTAASDLAGYRQAYSITALPTCTTVPGGEGTTSCFAQVDSETGDVISNPASVDTGADGETGLDMDMVSAACPDCSILLVGINSTSFGLTGDNGWQAFVDAVATAKRLGASAISISWGGPENTDPNLISTGGSDGGVDTSGAFTSDGHLVFVASGDFAYLNQNNAVDQAETTAGDSPSYPSSAPDVLAVGGTMLIHGTSGYTEAVWDDGAYGIGNQDITTSGCSTEFAMPSWQSSVLTGTSCEKRATADLAAAAAFASGGTSEGIVICASNTFENGEGTSAASPLMAAIFTRMGLTTTVAGNLGWVYDHGSAFNDLGSTGYPADTTGNLGTTTDAQDPSTCGKLCSVGTGWDGPSGMGTPNATLLGDDADAGSGSSSSSSGGSSSSSSSSSSGGSSSSSSSSSGGHSSSSSSSSSSGGHSSSSGSSSSGGHSSSSSSSSSGGSSSGISSSSGGETDGGESSSSSSSSSGGSASSGSSSGAGSSGSSSGTGEDDDAGSVASSGGTSGGGIGSSGTSSGGGFTDDDAGTDGGSGGNGETGTSNGCSVSVAGHAGQRNDSGLAPLGLALGVALVGARRRRRRD